MSQFDQEPTYQPPSQQPTGPQPPYGQVAGLSAEDRNLGTIAHVTPLVLMLVSGGLAGFIGSLVVYLYAKDRSPASRQYAAGALNVQIIVSIAAAVSYVSCSSSSGSSPCPSSSSSGWCCTSSVP
jgi:uncharacterized protein